MEQLTWDGLVRGLDGREGADTPKKEDDVDGEGTKDDDC